MMKPTKRLARWLGGSETTTDGHFKQIMTQKWLALYPDGNEAWAEFRRTGLPEAHSCRYYLGVYTPVGNIRQETPLHGRRVARES